VFYDELNIEAWGGKLLHAWMFTSLREIMLERRKIKAGLEFVKFAPDMLSC
jgi:hypothetical protein